MDRRTAPPVDRQTDHGRLPRSELLACTSASADACGKEPDQNPREPRRSIAYGSELLIRFSKFSCRLRMSAGLIGELVELPSKHLGAKHHYTPKCARMAFCK